MLQDAFFHLSSFKRDRIAKKGFLTSDIFLLPPYHNSILKVGLEQVSLPNTNNSSRFEGDCSSSLHQVISWLSTTKSYYTGEEGPKFKFSRGEMYQGLLYWTAWGQNSLFNIFEKFLHVRKKELLLGEKFPWAKMKIYLQAQVK